MTVNPNVATANVGDYVDWVDACQGIAPPVEGQGDRVELQLNASIESLYTQIQNLTVSMSDWQASVNIDPADTLDLWSSSTGGSAVLTAAQFDQLLPRATIPARFGYPQVATRT